MSQTHILTKANRDRILTAIGKLDLTKPWELSLKPWVKHRTASQNARLWLLHTKASEVTGYAPEELHELALKRFFGTRQVVIGDQEIEVPLKRSSARDAKEFAEFMTSVEAWYIETLGVFLS